jgi:hypothetical protein
LTAIFNGRVGSAPQQLYIATSTDAGMTWTVGNGGSALIPVGSGGSWNDVHIAHACLLLEGANWAIYASGFDGANWRTGRWTSPTLSDDPADWTPDAGNPIIGLGSGSDPDVDGAFIPSCQYDDATGTTRIWYTGVDGSNFSGCYAERDSSGTITKFGEVLPRGGSGTWNEVGTSPIAPHEIGGDKRLFLGGQAASGVSEQGYATYTDPQDAGTYTNHGSILAGPFTVSDGDFESPTINSILPYGSEYLVFGALIHPVGFPANQREISYRTTSPDGLTFDTLVGPIFPMSTAWPNTESAENPAVVVTP